MWSTVKSLTTKAIATSSFYTPRSQSTRNPKNTVIAIENTLNPDDELVNLSTNCTQKETPIHVRPEDAQLLGSKTRAQPRNNPTVAPSDHKSRDSHPPSTIPACLPLPLDFSNESPDLEPLSTSFHMSPIPQPNEIIHHSSCPTCCQTLFINTSPADSSQILTIGPHPTSITSLKRSSQTLKARPPPTPTRTTFFSLPRELRQAIIIRACDLSQFHAYEATSDPEGRPDKILHTALEKNHKSKQQALSSQIGDWIDTLQHVDDLMSSKDWTNWHRELDWIQRQILKAYREAHGLFSILNYKNGKHFGLILKPILGSVDEEEADEDEDDDEDDEN